MKKARSSPSIIFEVTSGKAGKHFKSFSSFPCGNILYLPVLQICEHWKKNVCENAWESMLLFHLGFSYEINVIITFCPAVGPIFS